MVSKCAYSLQLFQSVDINATNSLIISLLATTALSRFSHKSGDQFYVCLANRTADAATIEGST